MQLTDKSIIYPTSDGQPMADSTIQYKWITQIKGGCESLFKDANVFVAGDLFWYPVEGSPHICQAPDVMVVFNRPQGHRTSYKQWEEDNIPPQVVFEIRSHSDSQTKMDKKLVFYNSYGVLEYYVYDPKINELTGWLRTEGNLDVIDPIADWVSPLLGVRFLLTETTLEIYAPNGELFVDYVELYEQREVERQQRELAEQKAQISEQKAQISEQKAQISEQRAQRLAAQLRAMGIEPDI